MPPPYRLGAFPFMRIRLNGQDYEIRDGATVEELLRELKLIADRVAVEVNLTVVPKGRRGEVSLREGDRVEIVHFVGGG